MSTLAHDLESARLNPPSVGWGPEPKPLSDYSAAAQRVVVAAWIARSPINESTLWEAFGEHKQSPELLAALLANDALQIAALAEQIGREYVVRIIDAECDCEAFDWRELLERNHFFE